MLRYWVTLAIVCVPAFGAVDALQEAVTRMYDFDFTATHQTLDRYIVDHSSEPLPYAFRASAYLFSEMDRLGILEGRCQWIKDNTRRDWLLKRIGELWPAAKT